MSGGPRAFETFAGNFLRRVDAEFAFAGDFGGVQVEQIVRSRFFTNGLRTLISGKAEKSRSADHYSLTPWWRQSAAMRAS